jgi:hypothetical protein
LREKGRERKRREGKGKERMSRKDRESGGGERKGEGVVKGK